MSDEYELENILASTFKTDAIPQFETVEGVPVAMLPREAHVRILDELLPKPRYAAQNVRLQDTDSFVKYVMFFDTGETAVMFDKEKLKFEAVVDYHNSVDANNTAHIATYPLALSSEVKAWKMVNGKNLSQDQWLEFLEDHDDDFVSPTPADIITLIRNFSAKKISSFSSSRTIESGDVNIQFTTDTQAKADIDVPREITISIPVFENENAAFFRGRFTYRVQGGQLFMSIKIKNLQKIIDREAMKIVENVREDIEPPVYLGTF